MTSLQAMYDRVNIGPTGRHFDAGEMTTWEINEAAFQHFIPRDIFVRYVCIISTWSVITYVLCLQSV